MTERRLRRGLERALRLSCPRLPILFLGHSKSFWLALDYLLDPEDSKLRVVHDRSV